MSCHRARDRVEVGRPAAAGFELVRCLVERSGAGGARVDPVRRHVLVVGARVGGFGALFAKNTELLWLKDSWLASRARRSWYRGSLLPLFSTARHSFSLFSMGYAMFPALELLNRDPRRGNVGIDLRTVQRRKGDRECWVGWGTWEVALVKV